MWIPKYRKQVLLGPGAVPVRDLLRQIAMEHELQIISGKVAREHVHLFCVLGAPPPESGYQQNRTMTKR